MPPKRKNEEADDASKKSKTNATDEEVNIAASPDAKVASSPQKSQAISSSSASTSPPPQIKQASPKLSANKANAKKLTALDDFKDEDIVMNSSTSSRSSRYLLCC